MLKAISYYCLTSSLIHCIYSLHSCLILFTTFFHCNLLWPFKRLQIVSFKHWNASDFTIATSMAICYVVSLWNWDSNELIEGCKSRLQWGGGPSLDLPGYLISRPQLTTIHFGAMWNATENGKQKTAAAANVHQMSRICCLCRSIVRSIDGSIALGRIITRITQLEWNGVEWSGGAAIAIV